MTLTTPSIENIRKASRAVYLACEAPVADDISNLLKWSADEIERLTFGVRGWQPIATAPKQETVLVAGGDALYPVTASWDGGFSEDDCWWVDGQEDAHCEIGWPTHWMPLPEPPAAPAEDDADA